MNQIIELQKQMNEIVFNQMKQQREFIEKQQLKKKELNSAVKLPKLESRFFLVTNLNGRNVLGRF